MGTSPDAIDLAEDRERFQQLLQKLDLLQPENGIAHSADEAREIVERVGLPVVIRPSYVLGGRAMEVVHHLAIWSAICAMRSSSPATIRC